MIKTHSLRFVIGAVLVALTLPFVAMAGGYAYYGYWGLQGALSARSFDQTANRFVAGLYEILLERVELNNALQAMEPASPAVVARIKNHRRVVQDNFTPALADLQKRVFPNKAQLMENLRKAQAKADAMRERADAAIMLARDARDQETRARLLPELTASVDGALAVWFGALGSAAAGDAELLHLAAVKEIGWRLRDYVGRQRSQLSDAIARTEPIGPARKAAITALRAQVALLWTQLDAQLAANPPGPKLKRVVEDAKKAHAEFNKKADELLTLGGASGDQYGLTADGWVELSTPLLARHLDILYGAASVGEEITAHKVTEETTQMMVGLALLCIALAGGFGAQLFAARRVIAPLDELTHSLDSLASGNLAAIPSGLQRRDEIGAIARSVEGIKQAMGARARAESQANEQQAQSEREKERARAEQQQGLAREQQAIVDMIGGALSRLAARDLAFSIGDDAPPAYRRLCEDFNRAVVQLGAALQSVSQSSQSVLSGAQEIAHISQGLAEQTEQQASSQQQTHAALSTLREGVCAVTREAAEAREAAAAAKADASESSAVMRAAVEAMSKIEASSHTITNIIGVIDEIAFQTNLLALNAGVEAARAGDAGKGFAVVASEVRALAQRSAEAAKEIKRLIDASSAQVDEGVSLVTRAGSSLDVILEQIARTDALMTEIATGAAEQDKMLSHVADAMNAMETATRRSAEMADNGRAASRSLESESQTLAQAIGSFSLDDDKGGNIGRARAPVRTPAPLAKSAPGGDLRQQLKKAAPHAFAPRPAGRPASPSRPAVVASADHANDWAEF